jgi:hypothetical protein
VVPKRPPVTAVHSQGGGHHPSTVVWR